MTHKIDLHKNLKKLINENALNLIVHQYGNYAIQTIIENWDESDLEGIINIYKNKYVFLSTKKFSSNVIERILEKNEKNVNNYIDLICEGCNIIEILKNKYGNFVIKKAINLSKGKKREKLVKEINEALKFLDNQKIIDKWKENLVENSSSI
jgi:pumilio RNA-binding family